jgi:hypothetical protein
MHLISVLMVAGLLGQAPDQGGKPAAPASSEAKPATVSLFNGKDLEGWSQPLDNAAEWAVSEGGILEARGGSAGQPAVLVADRPDFPAAYRLRVVYGSDTPACGGVEVRRAGEGPITSSCFVTAGVGPHWLARERPAGNVTRLKDYRYGVTKLPPARPSARQGLAVNRWHTLDVVVNGNTVTTFVNGKKADSYIDRRASAEPGGISLFCCGDSAIRVKAVEIEELPAK